MVMIDRILALLKTKGLSPSQFADAIGVQRSAISHLISGRNNPSLDFVLKILKRYPDVNPAWLLNGSGEMELVPANPSGTQDEGTLQEEIALPYEIPEIPETPKPRRPRQNGSREKRVEKIILIYNDNTFRELTPENS
jgi:transcriptional regulator with XRE-family HTH domain